MHLHLVLLPATEWKSTRRDGLSGLAISHSLGLLQSRINVPSSLLQLLEVLSKRPHIRAGQMRYQEHIFLSSAPFWVIIEALTSYIPGTFIRALTLGIESTFLVFMPG